MKSNNGIIYQFTGNPFVDAGIWAICGWVDKGEPEELNKEDLKRVAKDITPLYLTSAWSKNIYSIFPNNPITNPSVKDKESRLKEFLYDLIEEVEPINDSGNCISCGRRDVKVIRTKTEIPLIGSGGLINYFPFGQPGADYCPSCTLAVQFSPLVMYSCVKLLLLHSNSGKVMRLWSRDAIQEIRRQILAKDFIGCFDENYKNPRNALFHIIQNIITKYDERWHDEKPSISLYHFTNYIQGPDLNVYNLPTPVFRFLAYLKQHPKYDDWKKILKRGYAYVDWNKVKDEEEYKNKKNQVYDNLLNGISITRFFINHKEKTAYGDWDLLSYYLKEVRMMEKRRLETLKRVGDELSEYIKNTQNIKRLNQLEQAKKYETLRNILRLIEKDRVKKSSNKALFTLDEFVTDLFPDGYLGWKETQDLLIFRVYENLHDWLVEQKELLSELNVEEEVMEEKNND